MILQWITWIINMYGPPFYLRYKNSQSPGNIKECSQHYCHFEPIKCNVIVHFQFLKMTKVECFHKVWLFIVIVFNFRKNVNKSLLYDFFLQSKSVKNKSGGTVTILIIFNDLIFVVSTTSVSKKLKQNVVVIIPDKNSKS